MVENLENKKGEGNKRIIILKEPVSGTLKALPVFFTWATDRLVTYLGTLPG